MVDEIKDSSESPTSSKPPNRNAQKRVVPVSFSCPNCAGTVILKAGSHTKIAYCTFCAAAIETTNSLYKLLTHYTEQWKPSLIEIGQRGTLFGAVWEVIGYMERSDGSGQYRWEEYLLFNPYYGFSFLVHSYGHWNYVEMLRKYTPPQTTTIAIKEFEFEGLSYRHFHEGEAKVRYVKGEFFWIVKQGDTTSVSDYIAPPYLISIERYKGEVVCSQAIYIEPQDIMRSFGIKEYADLRTSVAPNQPNSYQTSFKKNIPISVTTLVALVMLFIVYSSAKTTKEVLVQTLEATLQNRTTPLISLPFTISKDNSNLDVSIACQLNNQWVEVNHTLINEENNFEFDFVQATEYYSGTEGGESWSEGSYSTSSLLTSLQRGVYKLLMTFDGNFDFKGTFRCTLRAVNDVKIFSNLFLYILLALLFPLYLWIRSKSFETRRWAESSLNCPITDE
jgi:hypothetical protein